MTTLGLWNNYWKMVLSAARDRDIGSKIAHFGVAPMRIARDSVQLGTNLGFHGERSFQVETIAGESNF
jgi:hypothetical protein